MTDFDDRPLTSNQFAYHETGNMRDKPAITQADIAAVDKLMEVNIDICPCNQCRDQYEALLASHREYGYHTGADKERQLVIQYLRQLAAYNVFHDVEQVAQLIAEGRHVTSNGAA